MRLGDVGGVARAQRLAREVIHEVGSTLAPGQSERDVAARIDESLERAGVRQFLHTAYAWWGGRTRFSRFVDWEPDALPTDRRLEDGEPWIIDVAPIVDGHPADYALSGVAGEGPEAAVHRELLGALVRMKARLVELAKGAATGADLFRAVGTELAAQGLDAIHPRYPGGVLAHAFPADRLPGALTKVPRIGSGFQLPIMGLYVTALARHKLLGGPYPFVNDRSPGRPQGLWAVEPHVARGGVGAKFESILLIDGDETRWLDPDLFGEVQA